MFQNDPMIHISILIYSSSIFCADHPLPVIAVDMFIIVVLCTGLSLLRITTDPIELWAAPQSRYVSDYLVLQMQNIISNDDRPVTLCEYIS